MKKHELLKHAYDNYPKGTIIHVFMDEVEASGRYVVTETGINDEETGYVIYSSVCDCWAQKVFDVKK